MLGKDGKTGAMLGPNGGARSSAIIRKLAFGKRLCLKCLPAGPLAEQDRFFCALQDGVKKLRDNGVPFVPLFFLDKPMPDELAALTNGYNKTLGTQPKIGFTDTGVNQYYPVKFLTGQETELASKQSYAVVHLVGENHFSKEHNGEDKGGILVAMRKRVKPLLPAMVPYSPFYYQTDIFHAPVENLEKFARNLAAFVPELSAAKIFQIVDLYTAGFKKYVKEKNINVGQLLSETRKFAANSLGILADALKF